MATIAHFEMPADDTERARKFYSSLFGWKMEKCSPSGGACGDYWYFQTGDAKNKQAACGGIMKRQCPEHGPMIYFGVASVEAAAKKAVSLGAKIFMEKTAVPGMGYFICLTDTEGNGFALWEEDEAAK